MVRILPVVPLAFTVMLLAARYPPVMVKVSPAMVTELPVEIFPAEVIEPPVMDMAPAEVMVLALFIVISLVLTVMEPPELKEVLVPFITIVLPVTVAEVTLSEPLPLSVSAVLVSVVPVLLMAALLGD